MEKETDHIEEVLVPDMTWASWDFQPSLWSAGTLLVNGVDDVRAPFVGYAAPGVSLCGESGFETARWRRASWPSSEAFLLRHEPESLLTLELDCVCAEIPDDFADWATDATAAQVERLRAISAHSREPSPAADLADLLHAEMEMTFPGALERMNEEFAERLYTVSSERPSRFHAWLTSLARSFDRRQAFGVGMEAAGLLLAYSLYHLVREPEAPKGMQVGLTEALRLPAEDFFVWLYGLGHVLLPIAFLAWVYFRRPSAFAFVRNTLAVTASVVVVAYLLYSPKPVYAKGPAQSVPSDALATMPALHLGVALALACFGVVLSRSILARACWVLYPVLVAVVLTTSGSRYPGLTIGIAIATLALSLLLVRHVAPRLRLTFGLAVRPRAGSPIG
jgi:PAP2 superfamily